MKTICTLSLTCLALLAAGQSPLLPEKVLQQRLIGAGGHDVLTSVVVNWRGDIATVGNASSGKNGGRDIHLAVFDAQLNPLFERHIGRQNDDGAHQMAVRPDGRYLVAGFSTKPNRKNHMRAHYFGKRDAWLLLLDEKGETERELILGTAQDDELQAVAVCADGSAWLAGNSADEAWIIRLSANLEVLWEKKVRYHGLPTQVAAATLNSDGSFYVVGAVTEANVGRLWLAGFSQDGTMAMEKIFPSAQAEAGTGIAALDDGRVAVVGSVNQPGNREDGFLSILNRLGIMQHYTPLGGREYDRVQTVFRTRNGQLLAAGGSASFERGSRRISAWFSEMDAQGAAVLQSRYYGSKQDDEVKAICEHPDGRLFAVGASARQVLKMQQGWLIQLLGRTPESANAALNFKIKTPAFSEDEFLLSGQRISIPVSIQNEGNIAQHHLRATIKAANPEAAALLRIPGNRSVWLPPVAANATLDWGIPFCLTEAAKPGLYQWQVQFFQGEKTLGPPQTLDIWVGAGARPQLEITAFPIDSILVLGQEGHFVVDIQNTGNLIARNLTININLPDGISGPNQLQLEELAPGEGKSQRIKIVPENTAVGANTARIAMRVFDENLIYSASTEMLLTITTPPATTTSNDVVAVWVYPNPDHFERAEIVWPQQEITLQVKIISKQPVAKQQFCLEINGKPCPTGVKFDEVQIKGDKTSKTFSQTIRLEDGVQTIRATVQTTQGVISSEPLKIICSPTRPNLHIVSIGVPSADLKYTVKDARDFAQTLAGAQNMAFGKIFLDTLLTEEQTTKTEVLKTLRRLQYRYSDLQILPRDLLVIFVSGHGLGDYDGRFRVAASDYDSPFMQETSLDFEQEIVNYLQQVACRKLFLVDACHSGTTSGMGLAGIAARKNGMNMLVSCRPDEFSYEDDNWQNGAFTHALVQGFKAFLSNPAGIDTNGDAQLDAPELFSFIEKKVPELVDKKRLKTGASQHPNLFLSPADKALILFEKGK